MSVTVPTPLVPTVGQQTVGRLGIPFPPDRRTRVQQTTQAPWSAIGLVSARMRNGRVLEATGFVIDSRFVITAAHAVHNAAHGGDAVGVSFQCARDATRAPFGSVEATRWDRPAQYPAGGVPYDYCLIRLATSLPSEVTRYRLRAATDRELEAGEYQIAGYPDDKAPENSMWYDSGRLLSPPNPRILRYRISTAAGESGAAVSTFLDTQATAVVGIHSGRADDSSCNEAVRVTEEVIDQIRAWQLA
jgi:V8-like Glu-specific endopeptidase